MKIFGLEIKKAEKEEKTMVVEDVDLAEGEACPEDTKEPKKEKEKKGLGKKILYGIGAISVAGLAGLMLLSKLGGDPDEVTEESGEDLDVDSEEAPFTDAEVEEEA